MTTPISRRAVLAGFGVAAAVAGAPKADAEDQLSDADKIKKTDAKYQPGPKGVQRCQICLQFMPPTTCKIVQGPITATGWCQFFAARENAH